MSTEKVETIVFCERCEARCKVEPSQGSKAKMLRCSKGKGLCVNCAVHDWLRNTYPINMQLAEHGPKALLHPQIRELFADIMRVSCADARPEEINWTLINENWDLPFADKVKPTATNPCSQEELDAIAAGKHPGMVHRDRVSERARNPVFCRSIEDLNKAEPGLGDKVHNLLTDKHSKDNSKEKKMAKSKKKGEQMPLMDVGPENNQELLEAVREYKVHQKDRLAAGKKEFEAKEVVKALVLKSNLKPLKSGVIKFTCGNAEVKVTPRDVLITIKEKKTKKSKKGMKEKVEAEEQQHEAKK